MARPPFRRTEIAMQQEEMSNVSGPWTLGIDFGTTFTVAAVHHRDRTEVLEIDGQRRFPSAVFLEEDGSVVVGTSAERRGAAAPERFERTPKRYLDVGQPPIALGGHLVDVIALVAAVLRVVREEAIRQYGEDPPPTVVLTHPAGWGARRRDLLQRAAAEAGMPDAKLMSEPEGAAMYLAAERAAGSPIGHGEHVAVYDLGGGTFDACLLRRTGAGFEIVGEPGGDPRIGGEVFDGRLYRRLGQTGLDPDDWSPLQSSDDPSWMRANWEFRRGVREAKEAVSRDSTSPVYVPAPVERELQVTRAQVEDLVRDDIRTTLDVLEATIEQGGAGADALSAVYLVGGSSRMPVVAGMVRERVGRADTKGDPKHVVALGAAQAGAAPVEVAKPVEVARPATVLPPARVAPGLKPRRKIPVVAATLSVLALAVLVAGALLLPQGTQGSGVIVDPVITEPSSLGTDDPTPEPTTSEPTTPTTTTPTTTTPTATPTATATATASRRSDRSTVSGTLTDDATGAPYAGTIIQFSKLPESQGYQLRTTSDASSRYSIKLPAGDWRVAAVDENEYITFSPTGGVSNTISVPADDSLDFTGVDYGG